MWSVKEGAVLFQTVVAVETGYGRERERERETELVSG